MKWCTTLRVGKLVDRDRVAVAAACRQRQRLRLRYCERLGHMLSRQHRAGAARPHRMRVGPDVEIPIDNSAVAVERRLQLGHHRRPERLPGVLLFAHPLHAHGNTGQLRARSTQRRRRRRQPRCGRNSQSPRRGSAERSPMALSAFRRYPGDRDKRLGYASIPSWRRRPVARPRRTGRSSRVTDTGAYRWPQWSFGR